MKFEIISALEQVEIIAKGTGVDIRHRLNAEYGRHNWRKMKEIAVVEYSTGEIWLAEVHWYEVAGVGRKKEKDKRRIRRLA
jgi:hypothetical protein